MANRIEMEKYETVLPRPSEKEHFRTMFERCRLLSRNQPIRATDGEIMAVCAYQTGRLFAGSAATKDACAKLGCIDLKTFDKVDDLVSKLLSSKGFPSTLTVVSLAQKYKFPPDKLQQVQAVENDLNFALTEEEREDERVVCGIFAVVSKRLGLSPDKWILNEAKKYKLDMKEVKLLISRIEDDHGERITEKMRLYENSGTSSSIGQQSAGGRNINHTRNGSLALKRRAPEDLEEPLQSTPTKRQKVEPAIMSITIQDSFTPKKSVSLNKISSGKSNASYREATTDGEEVEHLLENELEPPTTSDSESSEDSNYIVLPLSEVLQLDWRALAEYRQRSINRQNANANPAVKSRAVFVDRTFWY